VDIFVSQNLIFSSTCCENLTYSTNVDVPNCSSRSDRYDCLHCSSHNLFRM